MVRLQTKGIKATFLTLTFHGNPKNQEAKEALKRFLMRIRRNHEMVSGLWRMEKQPGRGAINFHMILFNLPFIPQKTVQAAWTECTREDKSIIDIRLASGAKRIMSYISKYITKVDDGGELTSLEDVPYQHAPQEPDWGRCWGWLNKKSLPRGERREGFLVKWDTVKWLREICNALSCGKASQSFFRITLFSDQAFELFEWAMDQGGLTVSEFKDSTFAPNWEEMNIGMALKYRTQLNQ